MGGAKRHVTTRTYFGIPVDGTVKSLCASDCFKSHSNGISSYNISKHCSNSSRLIKLVQKIRAKHCKSSESSVYIVVAVYRAHDFPEDCLRLDSPLASKTALERHITLKYDACMRYLSNQLADIIICCIFK